MPVPYVSPRFQAIDGSGNPLVGGKLYTYANTTTTPQTTYQDAAGTTANTNPIILDARGESVIFLTEGQTYTFVLKDQNDALIWSQDSISGSESGSTGVTVVTSIPTSDIGPVYLAGYGVYSWNGTEYISDYSIGFNGGAFAFRNRLLNGDFTGWGRGTSIGPITSGSGNPYTANAWRCFIAGSASATVTQVSGGSDYGQTRIGAALAQVTSNAAASPGASDVNAFLQRIEGYNILNFAMGSLWGGSITLSFWVKASIAGTYSVAFRNGGSPGPRSYISNYTVNAANVPEFKSITIPIDQSGISNWNFSNSTGLEVAFDLGSGSTSEGAANTWLSTSSYRTVGSVRVIGTNGASIAFSRVQLEFGTVNTPFESRPMQVEEALYYRYRCTSGGNVSFTQPGNSGATVQRLSYPFPVEMRAIPNVVPTFVIGSGSVVGTTTKFFTVGFTGTAMQEDSFSWAASAEL